MTETEPTEEPAQAQPTASPDLAYEFALERYRYILQQINAVNENAYRFLAIYQALATTLAAGTLALFVGYRKWGFTQQVARDGVIGMLLLITFVATFTTILLVVGVFTWFDYRFEESDLTDKVVHPGFRERPRLANASRWYEVYIISFIILSVVVFWLFALLLLLPDMK